MKRYAFLVRGVNIGGRHKVVMGDFCRELENLGMTNEKRRAPCDFGTFFR